MKTKIRSLAILPTMFILVGCQVFVPSLPSTLTPVNTTLINAATYTLRATTTPAPTITRIPTSLPPSLTPTAITTSTPSPTLIPQSVQLSIFENMWSIVNDTYVYPDFNGLDWNAIHEEYSQKIKNGLTNDQFYLAMSTLIYRLGDDHSFFLDPLQVAAQEAEYQGKYDYVGIGVIVGAVPERKRAVILAVFPGGSAQTGGLQPRDSILSVDGSPILDADGYLRDIVRGPEGTSITITLQTPGEAPRDVQLTRHRITGDYSVDHQVITTPDGKRFGYILLLTFEDSTVDDQVATAIQEMTRDAPLDGLILDNRMNNGGSSTVFELMLGYFAGGDLGYYFKHGEKRSLHIDLKDVDGSSRLPLVILVGAGTASFGEIYSGILQDIGRAYLIGTTTDGNVEILWGYDLEDGSKLWLANETFRSLNHPDQDWEKTGIIPDLTVPGDFDQYTFKNDPAISAALAYLSAR